jgi:transmembrane sensor
MGVSMTDDSDPSPAATAREAAIEWWVSSKASFSCEERAEFDAWLAADPANAAAYADIERTYARAKRVRRGRSRAGRPQAVRPEVAAHRGRGAAGAALAAAAGLALYFAVDPALLSLRSDFSTEKGEIKTVTLDDGSDVTLDAGSAIAVRFDADRRRVALLRGEAWFAVAKDTSRPFVVEAGGGTVTALGTAFEVDVASGVRVAVGEHSVGVSGAGGSVVVPEGRQTTFGPQSPPADPVNAPHSLAAWRWGSLIFEDRPLGEVLAALARYRRGFVYCLSAAVCGRPVTAVFSADDPSRALREIEPFLGLRAVRLTDYLIVLYE